MHPTDFLINVTAHPDLHGVDGIPARDDGEPSPKDQVVVWHDARETAFALTIAEIRKHSWRDLEGVLTGTRPPDLMVRYTRIVGYYSRTNNWNRSKLAELRDRHAPDADYSVPEGDFKWSQGVKGARF